MIKECKKHGIVRHRLTENRFRCVKCSSEAVSKRRKLLKDKAIEYKGGVCNRCSLEFIPEVFEFHHLDPSKKEFAISAKGITRSWDKIKEELDKCEMLCANCHRITHAELNSLS